MTPAKARWNWDQAMLWLQACELSTGIPFDRNTHWFTGDDPSLNVQDDFEACALAAEQGDERAKHYMAKFMELRMKS